MSHPSVLRKAQSICAAVLTACPGSRAQHEALDEYVISSIAWEAQNSIADRFCDSLNCPPADGALGYALVIGVERLKGQTHPDRATSGSGNDARGLAELLIRKGFAPERVTTLITEQATRTAFKDELTRLADNARPQDLVVLYFSGHGGRQTDRTPWDDEEDDWDETLVLYDGSFLDDDIYGLLLRFPAGCRLVFINDACNAGTTYKFNALHAYVRQVENRSTNAPIMAFQGETEHKQFRAQMIYMGGSRDGESARGDEDGGRYTRLMLQFMGHPIQPRSYRELHERIVNLLDYDQRPTYEEIGPVDASFKDLPPLTIALP